MSWEVSKSSSMPETVGRGKQERRLLVYVGKVVEVVVRREEPPMKLWRPRRRSALAARSVGLLGANAKDPHLTRSPTLIQPVAELQRPTIIYYLQLNSLTNFQSLY